MGMGIAQLLQDDERPDRAVALLRACRRLTNTSRHARLLLPSDRRALYSPGAHADLEDMIRRRENHDRDLLILLPSARPDA